KIPEDIKGTFPEESKEITLTYKTLDINIPSQDVDNTKPGEISSYGIAYMPKQFQTNSTVLNDAGPQSIPINKKNRFDVGVRDLRNTASQWTLKAQLVWENGKELQGSSIKTTNNSGTVMKNTNNGVAPFNPDTDLTSSNNEVQGTANVEITSTQSTPLMVANKVAHNAIYNYNLGDVSLEIPETRMIQPGTYNGYVEWNLSNTL
ncbi:TPA: WxL domain-containing protein, partial [Enterococcus faecium]